MTDLRPRKRHPRPKTKRNFADIRRECEQKLACGEHVDFDKVMIEIAVLRKAEAR